MNLRQRLQRKALSEDTLSALFTAGSAVLAAVLVRNLARGGYRLTHDGTDPPQNPLDDDHSWAKSIAFMALTGAVVGVFRMLARRGAASAWKRYTGRYPAGLVRHEAHV